MLLAWLPLAATGCVGSFQLTRNLYTVNQEISPNRPTRWLTFLAFCTFPYPITLVLDAMILNGIEFWTGENPVEVPSESDGAPDGNERLAPSAPR